MAKSSNAPIKPATTRQTCLDRTTGLPLSPRNTVIQTRTKTDRNGIGIGFLLTGAAFASFAFLLRHSVHYDWPLFLTQLHRSSPTHILAGCALILTTNWLRSARWTIFLAPIKPRPPFSLVTPQFIGFTAVALFGRLADLTRPYLIGRRTGLPFASQIAIYAVERLFDLAAVAILFSVMLALTPAADPHHRILARAGVAALAGTAALTLATAAIRISGSRLAGAARVLCARFGTAFAGRAAEKILHFSNGLQTLGSLPSLVLALALSVAMWLMIAASYLQTVHAFPQTPSLATLTFPAILPLMAASMGGSLLQLPILGWFTQIALTATTMHTLYGAPIEVATACGAVLLLVGTLSVVPVGLVLTRAEHLSLRAVAQASHNDPRYPR